MNNLPARLRVMAEYSSSGIWVIDPGEFSPFRHGMISYEQLGLPESLADEFKSWIAMYNNRLPDRKTEINLQEFDRIGKDLAKKLKAFVGPNVYVEYEPEESDFGKAMMAVYQRELTKEYEKFIGTHEEFEKIKGELFFNITLRQDLVPELEALKRKLTKTEEIKLKESTFTRIKRIFKK